MNRLNSIFVNIVATFFIWGSAAMVDLFTDSPDGLRTLAVLIALGTTAALWLIWALDSLGSNKPALQEKSKRRAAGDDARLSLLLELLEDDERQAIKQRLADDLGADGELVSLADLLDAQTSRWKR